MCFGLVIGIPDAAGNATGASFLDMLLIVAAVVGFILLGAYGIYLYQSGQTRYRNRIVDNVLTARTGHIQDANKVYEQDNAELSQANRKLNEVNQSLALANDSLALTNVQLSHSNRSLEIRTIELRDALEINKEILGVTAHDLKNPISGIIGLAEIVHEDLMASAIKVDPEIIEHVELIKVAAEQVFGTVLDLLDRHQLGGARQLRREFADLNEVVLSVLSWNRQTAIKKGIGLHFLPVNEVVSVNIDVLGIQRVIDNLISNAVKYSMPGADVWLEIHREPQHVLVQVRDEGPGLTEEDKRRVFGRLERLSARPTAGEHSTGLGLSIVKQLVEDHGGSVGVESVHGRGATFWFRLQLHNPHQGC